MRVCVESGGLMGEQEVHVRFLSPLVLGFVPLTRISFIKLVNYSQWELFNHPSLFNLSEVPPNSQQGRIIDVCTL